MPKRTIENCSLIKKLKGKPRQSEDKCDGFQVSEDDDEPCKICKKCRLNTFYEAE